MLNEEQRRLVDENEKLIYGCAHQYGIKLDEYYDVLAIGLCKAGMTYDENKGEFSTYAYTVMWREYLTEVDKKKCKKRNGVEVEFNENTPHKIIPLDTDIMILDYLDELEKEILHLKIRGYTYREIAKMLGLKHAVQVNRILNKTKEKLIKAGF